MQTFIAIGCGRRCLLTFVVVMGAIWPLSFHVSSASAARRTWSVRADCAAAGSATANPTVKVTMVNTTGQDLFVAYAHSLPAPRAIGTYLPGLKLADPGPQTIIDIADGASTTLAAAWAGGGPSSDPNAVGVLVVTSGGAALAGCQDRQAVVVTLPGPAPSSADEKDAESAAIAATTIGQLEAWRAYAPLYALLHPASRAQFSFGQMACWHVGQYGLPGAKDATTIYTTSVQNVAFVTWTWPGGLKEYAHVAEVSFGQETGVFPHGGKTVSGVEHLVRVDGVWRWFFGTAVDSAAHLTASCGLPTST